MGLSLRHHPFRYRSCYRYAKLGLQHWHEEIVGLARVIFDDNVCLDSVVKETVGEELPASASCCTMI